MNGLRLIVMFTLFLAGCGQVRQYDWVHRSANSELSPDVDLIACRDYAAKQYRPGIPAGDPLGVTSEDLSGGSGPGAPATGEKGLWHPDRESFPFRHAAETDEFGVIVPYTGYPGYLDYAPGYLDAILEKCMLDRGWTYQERVRPVSDELRQGRSDSALER